MCIISKVKHRIAQWYQGTYVPPPKNDPNSSIVFVGLGFYLQPPLARILLAVANFYRNNWQWIWSTLIALLSLWAAVLALK